MQSKKSLIYRLLEVLAQQSKLVTLTAAFLVTLLIGVMDYISGIEIAFAFFYLLPVSMAAWVSGKRGGIIISIESAAVWLIANRLAGEQLSHIWIPFWNAATRAGIFMIVTVLLSELHSVLDKEMKLARTDFLTGILNRLAFYDRADLEIRRAKRSQSHLTIVYIDLDSFKEINDQLGHHVGDALLQTVASVLARNTRSTDVLARLGGDEFTLLLPETRQKQSQFMIRRLKDLLLDEMHKHQWNVTFSIGVMTFIQIPEHVDELLHAVDQLTYEVKNSGKNAIMYAVYPPK